MKYFIAGLVIPSVQILFLLAFTVFALGIAVSSLVSKLKYGQAPAENRLMQRVTPVTHTHQLIRNLCKIRTRLF